MSHKQTPETLDELEELMQANDIVPSTAKERRILALEQELDALRAENEQLRTDNQWLVEFATDLLVRLKEVEGIHPVEFAAAQSELGRHNCH